MSEGRIEIQEAPRLKLFVMISLCLHITVMVFQGLMPDEKRHPKRFAPIKVSYLPPEQKEPLPKSPTLADISKPRKIESPKSSELISRYDSRAHSNQNKNTGQVYKNNKTVVPKNRKSKSSKHSRLAPKRLATPKTGTPLIKKPYHPASQGFILPKNKGVVSSKSSPSRVTGGTQALLEGFDAEKYAAMDTASKIAEDDGEVISLDTKESKYASYFARIKQQIERVWNYPSEAKRKGLSGQLTLRFQISKDGNLMNVRLVDDSGYNLLDQAALNAVKGAAPYFPFPLTIDREHIWIMATFIYAPDNSAQYFNQP